MNVAISQLNYHCNLKSVDIRWSKFSSKLVKLSNSSRSEKSFKLLELRVLFLFFYRMITAPGLLAFLQASFVLFFNVTQSGPFLSLHRDLAGI